jgi:SAM-dependent methyltransferase
MIETHEFFKRLLSHNWLRPELALVHAHQLHAVASLLPRKIVQPSLEYGCTDGVCTFVMLGGEADFAYDDYLDISDCPADSLADDYFEKASEIGNHVVVRPATDHFTYGVSWRGSHLARAARLRLYQGLMERDLGHPLPFESSSTNTIWAPNLFQVPTQQLLPTLQEFQRVLTPDGTIVTILPDLAQSDRDIWRRFPSLPQEVRDRMDRGISRNLTMNARSDADWRQTFACAGLRVTGHSSFLPKIVSEIYQIGLRPMFPALLEAYSLLRSADLEEFIRIKRRWIDTEYDFLLPMCDVGPEFGVEGELLWHAYRLERNV